MKCFSPSRRGIFNGKERSAMFDNPIKPDAIARGEYGEPEIDKWFASASARQLETYILCKKPYTRGNRQIEAVKAIECIERATIALNIRLAEDAAESANKLIQHTEKLTVQTDRQIEHSKTLTRQTDKLIAESVSLGKLTSKLYWLTWALGAFAVIQIILMVFDIWKHK